MARSQHIAQTLPFCFLFLALLRFVAAQVTTLDQLEQQLAAFPNYSLFLEALKAAPNFSTTVGDLNNKTIFAFTNSADRRSDPGGGGDFPFNLTIVRCAINDPSLGFLNELVYYNIIQGKYTIADLRRILPEATNLYPSQSVYFQTLIPGGPVTTVPLTTINGTIYVNSVGIPIVDEDLINDPTLSVHGISGLSLLHLTSGSPPEFYVGCTKQADPCNPLFGPRTCGVLDPGAVCNNPSFGVAVCQCSPGFSGTPCVPTTNSAPPPRDQGVCGTGAASAYPTRCYFNSDPQGRYVCCDSNGCNGFAAPDFVFPRCAVNGYAPPGYGVSASPAPVPPSPAPVPPPPSTPPSGDQGVCGSGPASAYPTRCYFNSDPQGRYVCCDANGCNGFNPPDYKFPHCANYGYVPDGYGVSGGSSPPGPSPPSPLTPSPPVNPPVGDQGVCGTGNAQGYPLRCWFNNDPKGRYVCCDNQGCNGFAPPDNLYPRCKNNGYAPPGTT